jgi:hypothetical protein
MGELKKNGQVRGVILVDGAAGAQVEGLKEVARYGSLVVNWTLLGW